MTEMHISKFFKNTLLQDQWTIYLTKLFSDYLQKLGVRLEVVQPQRRQHLDNQAQIRAISSSVKRGEKLKFYKK